MPNNYDSSTTRAGTIRKNTATALAISDGATQPLITDGNGNLYVAGSVNVSQVAGVAPDMNFGNPTANTLRVIPAAYNYTNISSNTTTVIKSGTGIMHTLVINTRGGTSTCTVYDNTAGSGTKIATIDTTLSTTAFVYDADFTTGLTIVTAGVSAADVTVTWI